MQHFPKNAISWDKLSASDYRSSNTTGLFPFTVYMHIPKTGGQTLQSIIGNFYRPCNVYHIPGDTDDYCNNFINLPESIKKRISFIIGHIRLNESIFSDLQDPFYLFTMLRDPVKRVISQYHFIKKNSWHALNDSIVSQNLSLEDFIELHKEKPRLNLMTTYLSGSNKLDNDAVEKAKINLKYYFTFFGLTDRYDELLLFMQQILGLPNVFYQAKNVSSTSQNFEINESFSEKIESAVKYDIELYNFAVDLYEQRIKTLDSDFRLNKDRFKALNTQFNRSIQSNLDIMKWSSRNVKQTKSVSKDENAATNPIMFLHIPKTGGQTIHHILLSQYRKDGVLSLTGDRLADYENLDETKKSHLKVISGHMPFGYHEIHPKQVSYFTLLRDPLKRAISSYKHIMQTADHPYHLKYREGSVSLENHLNDPLFDNFQTQRIMWDRGTNLLDHKPEDLSFNEALERLSEYFIFTGILEKFDEALMILKNIYNWPNPFYLRKNVSKQADFSLDCNQLAIDDFIERNRTDYKLYTTVKNQLEELFDQLGADFKAQVESFKAENSEFQRKQNA